MKTVSCVVRTLRGWGEMGCYEHQDPVEERVQVWWVTVARSFGWQKWSTGVSRAGDIQGSTRGNEDLEENNET